MGIISTRSEPTDHSQQGSTIISRANPRGRRIRKRVYETFSSLRVDHVHPTTVHSHFATHVVRGFVHKYLRNNRRMQGYFRSKSFGTTLGPSVLRSRYRNRCCESSASEYSMGAAKGVSSTWTRLHNTAEKQGAQLLQCPRAEGPNAIHQNLYPVESRYVTRPTLIRNA
jgi:hypothetical protein